MQENIKQPKITKKKNNNYVQERSESTNIGRDSLDVSPQTQDQSTKMPTKEARRQKGQEQISNMESPEDKRGKNIPKRSFELIVYKRFVVVIQSSADSHQQDQSQSA